MTRTTQVTSMIFLILIGATLFSLVFRALGGDDMVQRGLTNLPGGAAGAILAVMIAIFLLGFVMDAFEIIFVVVPIVAPALLKMPAIDPIWLAMMFALNLQTSYIHPPLGPTLFFLRGVAPPEITTTHIYVGIIPFVLIQLCALAVLCLGLLMVGIDGTIVNVALPSLVREIGASSTELQWVVDAYTIIFAGFLLIAGNTGDRLGRRRSFVFGLLVFVGGSLGCALVSTPGSLILLRGVQGFGAAFVMPATSPAADARISRSA